MATRREEREGARVGVFGIEMNTLRKWNHLLAQLALRQTLNALKSLGLLSQVFIHLETLWTISKQWACSLVSALSFCVHKFLMWTPWWRPYHSLLPGYPELGTDDHNKLPHVLRAWGPCRFLPDSFFFFPTSARERSEHARNKPSRYSRSSMGEERRILHPGYYSIFALSL